MNPVIKTLNKCMTTMHFTYKPQLSASSVYHGCHTKDFHFLKNG
uniref:Uncharacterized protein n=1 Tax=Anguilla anguilla TaxID=7936 RepID=A0A0E9XFB6_ANGAN